ncbi:MAG TPA: M28 family peptidase [Vicinamibacterales bacterium]|nr:M28 family peptidase [Vicinamibacterales bacterium]
MKFRRTTAVAAVAAVLLTLGPRRPVIAASKAVAQPVDARDLREWLTYIASDDLQGRAVFGTGIGLAASYIEDHLRAWGVKPAGDRGSYLQTVRIVGVKATSHSSVTVEVGGERRTFADGDGIRFPRNVGAKQQKKIDRVEFVGYGLDVPAIAHEDYRGRDVRDAAVIWLGAAGPSTIDQSRFRILNNRNQHAVEDRGGAAVIGAGPAPRGGRAGRAGQAGQPGASNAPDFTTTERLDHLLPPSASGNDAFFEFLFSRAPVKYAELKTLVDARQPLPSFRLEGVTLFFDINNDYEPVRTQLAQNVVGIVDGSDPQLKSTYVAFGAHYDHVGYADGELTKTADGQMRRAGAPGRVTPGAEDDRIWNGADDDGSGTVTLMALARAFAQGPKPKRSLLFVWHTGEERGRWGSLYFVDHPTVDLARVVAQLNVDMIGRNRDDKASEWNTTYLVGSDRISTELDRIAQAANRSLPKPLMLDYELNDPSDPESVYMRSDHYSYASRGIPIIFFTNALHPDYHANTDEVAKIEFEKMARVGALIYGTAWRVASLDHAPVRDRLGPRQMGLTGALSATIR